MVTRHIQPELVAFLDERLEKLLTYRQALMGKDARLIFLLAMQTLVGVREAGDNAGRIVQLLQRTIGAAEHEPWCMAAVQSCIAYAELKTGARSRIFATEHCMTCWRETPPDLRVKSSPLPGAIIIWKHGNTDSGHTGATLSVPVNRLFNAIEGNTTSGNVDGQIIRDGGGMYQTRRSQDGAGDMHLVGFLKPFDPLPMVA